MRYGTYFPALAGCFALLLLAATVSQTVGQSEVRITDESSPAATEPTTKITVTPGQPAAATTPAAEKPAAPAVDVDIKLVVAEISKMEAQADKALANQQKIDTDLEVLAKTIEQARIYASRSGKKNATTAP